MFRNDGPIEESAAATTASPRIQWFLPRGQG